jgi:hypothetical protein
MRVLRHGDQVVDLAAAAEAAARSGFPAVSLQGVGKRYGEGETAVDALGCVDLEVWPGEFAAQRASGVNGCGRGGAHAAPRVRDLVVGPVLRSTAS